MPLMTSVVGSQLKMEAIYSTGELQLPPLRAYTILTIPTILVWKSRGERGQFEMSLAFQTSAPVR
jgi:hypothetical protein